MDLPNNEVQNNDNIDENMMKPLDKLNLLKHEF